MKHQHRKHTSREQCWTYCVAGHAGDHVAHGNIVVIDKCRCGATRSSERT